MASSKKFKKIFKKTRLRKVLKFSPSRRSRKFAKLASSGGAEVVTTKGVFEGKKSREGKTPYDSEWEKRRMEVLDADPTVEWWTKAHDLRIPYYDLSKSKYRTYVPDILVKRTDGKLIVEEIKGWIRNPLEFALKKAAAIAWAPRCGYTYRVLLSLEEVEKMG